METGKLPQTQFMELMSNEDQWRLLISGLINEIKTSAIVEKEPGRKVRISLVIDMIIPPEYWKNKTICHVDSNVDKNIVNGISRTREFINDHLSKSAWLFSGYIDGNTKVPIVIIYYQSVNLTVYTQKLSGEDIYNFLPYPQQN